MKVLCVGKCSYLAATFNQYLCENRDSWSAEFVSVRDDAWRHLNYAQYDSIIYFAAIVHHPEITVWDLYRRVNVDIPNEMARKAKQQGVRLFVYISSCAVWGIGPLFGKPNVINDKTPLEPETLYGKSKLMAEEQLMTLNDASFHVARVRLPNVYGENCPGTFWHRIEALAKMPILPVYKEEYPFSLIHVRQVAEALMTIVEKNMEGICCPQDPNIRSIVCRIREMAKQQGRRQMQTRIFWPLMWLLNKWHPNKYLNNLYGGYYLHPDSFPVIVNPT